jgi:hypothetical protein
LWTRETTGGESWKKKKNSLNYDGINVWYFVCMCVCGRDRSLRGCSDCFHKNLMSGINPQFRLTEWKTCLERYILITCCS